VNESALGPIEKDIFKKEQEDLGDLPKKACDFWVSYDVSYVWFPLPSAHFKYEWHYFNA
jgi:hypothetical protein